MIKNISLLILVLMATACQSTRRQPNQIATTPLMTLIENDQKWVSDIQHASQVSHYDNSQRPVLLIIHGLHESPYYMKHWSDFFAQQNYQIVSMRLPGHFEKSKNALETVTAEQWIERADLYFKSLTQKHSKISILGYSTGGTLATYLALQYPQSVEKMFLISPALSLSNSVFLSGLFLGKTSISGQKSCQEAQSILCQIIKNIDDQTEQMLNEGLEMSPQAGRQVQRLIDLTFKPSNDVNNYYEDIINTLLTIQTPTYIADSEIDNVVNTRTNREWMKRSQNLKRYLYFTKNNNILHTQMARGLRTQFSSGVVRFNQKIQQIENLFLTGIK